MTELYQNLTFETLSGSREIQFEKISDLVSHINFKLQYSLLANLDIKDNETKKNNDTVREKYNFDKKPRHLWGANCYGHTKQCTLQSHVETDASYVEPTVKDAQKFEEEIKKKKDYFLKTATDFNKVNTAATIQKERFLWWFIWCWDWFNRQLTNYWRRTYNRWYFYW